MAYVYLFIASKPRLHYPFYLLMCENSRPAISLSTLAMTSYLEFNYYKGQSLTYINH